MKKLNMVNQKKNYVLIEDTYKIDDISYKGYGILLKDENSKHIISFADISTNKDDILHLIDLCNTLELDPIHLEDVIEDFFASI